MVLRLEDFAYVPRIKGLVQTPAFPTGDFGRAFYDLMKRDVQENFAGNKYLDVLAINERTGEVNGSNLFVVARADQLTAALNLGIRPVTLPELSDEEILRMVKDSFYVDTPAVVLKGTGDSIRPKNNPLAKHLAEYVEGFSPEKPALITGFGVEHWPGDERGYHLKLVPLRKSFDFELDDRFSSKYDGWRFTKVDEKGIPTDLTSPDNFTEEDGRIWRTGEVGLSRLVLNGDLSFYSGWYDLAGSDPVGRVVFKSAEGARA